MRLIDADALMADLYDEKKHNPLMSPFKICTADRVDLKFLLNEAPAIDAVPIADVEAWLLEIAYNCVGVQDDLSACAEDLANRMDGLMRFSADRRHEE